MKISFNFEKKIENLAKEKPKEVLAHVKYKITNVFQFEILKRQYIEQLWQGNKTDDKVYAICLNEVDLENINFSKCIRSLEFINDINKVLNCNNFFTLNENLNIINCEHLDSGLYNYCCEKSKLNNCIFFLSKYEIKIFINGEIIVGNSLFISDNDYIEYSNKKDISQIKEVFQKYQEEFNTLILDGNIFFEKDLTNVKNENGDKNILRYQPDKYMREHLRDFLNKNVKRTFNMNYILSNSKREIDIYTEDSDFYFFTIRWIGTSINENGTELNPPLTQYNANSGIIHTLEYIKELIEYEKFSEKTLKKGCLVIFDARDIKSPIQFYDFNSLDPELKKYIDHFELINEIKIDKRISA